MYIKKKIDIYLVYFMVLLYIPSIFYCQLYNPKLTIINLRFNNKPFSAEHTISSIVTSKRSFSTEERESVIDMKIRCTL